LLGLAEHVANFIQSGIWTIPLRVLFDLEFSSFGTLIRLNMTQ
jgi:hypothetical protein